MMKLRLVGLSAFLPCLPILPNSFMHRHTNYINNTFERMYTVQVNCSVGHRGEKEAEQMEEDRRK